MNGIPCAQLTLLFRNHKQTMSAKTIHGVKQYTQCFLEEAQRWAKLLDCSEIWHQLAQYQYELSCQYIAQIERDLSSMNAAAMSGMSMGMLTSTATALVDTVEQAGVPIQITSTVMETVSGSVFLASQLAMTTYGASKIATGKLRDQALKKDQKTLQKLNQILDKKTLLN